MSYVRAGGTTLACPSYIGITGPGFKPGANFLLLANGVNYVLLVDGVSRIELEGSGPPGFILLSNGINFLLLANGVSKIRRA